MKLLVSSWYFTAAALLLILCVPLFALGDYVMGTIFVAVALVCSIRGRRRRLRQRARKG